MKKVNGLKLMAGMAMIAMMMTACTSEEKQIVGSWEVTGNIQQQEYTADVALQEKELDAIYEDGTYIDNKKGYLYTFRDDRTGSIVSDGNVTNFRYYFEDGDDDDIIIVSNTTENWEIEKLNHKTMILELDIDRHNNTANGHILPHHEMRYEKIELTKK